VPPTAGVRLVAALGIQQEEIEREKLLNGWRYGQHLNKRFETRVRQGAESRCSIPEPTLSHDSVT
jgi:hypothetical protein